MVVVFLSIVFVEIPLLLISLNRYFGLPIYASICLKIIGTVFIVGGFSVVIYYTILHIKTGRTTPLPVIEQPKKFIVNGLYKYCRNPMYLAEIFIFLGLFFLLGYLLLFFYSMAFFSIVNMLVIYIEEPEMQRKFGKQYAEYVKKVPRWIPKTVNLL